jgi:HK97 family phage prohead protease
MTTTIQARRPRRYLERRFTASPFELRSSNEGVRFRGHAAVVDQETDLGYMREKVAPGAFTKTIKDGADVRVLFNHDPNTVMARTSGGSLRLSEDSKGLAVDADLDHSDPDVQRLLPKLRNGNVTQMSFGFTVVREQVEEQNREIPLRILKEVELFDVSPVTFPAYGNTDGGLAMRAAEELGSPVAVPFILPAVLMSDAASRTVDVPELEVRRLVRALKRTLNRPDIELPPDKVGAAISSLNALERTSNGRVSMDRTTSTELAELKRMLDANRRKLAD